MSATSNEQIVRSWVEEVWNRGNEASIRRYFHPQAIGHLEGAGDVHGPEGLIPQWRLLRDAFPDFHLHIDDLLAQGDTVVMRWTVNATHQGNALGFPATGRKVRFDGLTWMRFRDGQMIEGWDRWNQGGVLQQLQAG